MASGGGGRRGRKAAGGRARAKGRKTKYLSLSRLIKKEAGTPPPREEEVKREDEKDGGAELPPPQQQVEPFALLHHEASTLFEALPAPSLTEILGASASASAAGGESPSPSPPASPGGRAGFPGRGAEVEDLARRALRGRERWVYCATSGSSPTATTATTTTTTTATTCSSSPCSSAASTGASARSLLLKLDYEAILAAWADRGSLYIGGAGGGGARPKPEPGLDAVLVEVELSEPAAAAAPATAAAPASSAPETAGPARAERVRRYKEKRRNRLFAKRIRYEVRRVNAVKRPRFKGRFIKENEESELQPA